ncbi:MAG: hypothetical protein HC822_08030 [Oscillochloris sp.]|nr:hypothetical protein [Oscillochloris sp.]
MIDLHTHILPDIDDGSRTLDAALEMVQIAVADGVSTVAATPHGRSSVSAGVRYHPDLVHKRVGVLREAIAEAGLNLTLVPGTEIYGEPGVEDRLDAGELLGYGTSRAVLVEFAAGATPATVEQIVFGLQLRGRRVVLAHPERLRFVQHDPNTLAPLIARGVVMQLTADALLGAQGRRLQDLAETLLTHDLVQLIASDAHGPHLARMPNLGDARRRTAVLRNEATAERLTNTTPAAILADTPLDLPAPSPVRRRFGFW